MKIDIVNLSQFGKFLRRLSRFAPPAASGLAFPGDVPFGQFIVCHLADTPVGTPTLSLTHGSAPYGQTYTVIAPEWITATAGSLFLPLGTLARLLNGYTTQLHYDVIAEVIEDTYALRQERYESAVAAQQEMDRLKSEGYYEKKIARFRREQYHWFLKPDDVNDFGFFCCEREPHRERTLAGVSEDTRGLSIESVSPTRLQLRCAGLPDFQCALDTVACEDVHVAPFDNGELIGIYTMMDEVPDTWWQCYLQMAKRLLPRPKQLNPWFHFETETDITVGIDTCYYRFPIAGGSKR